MNFTFLKNLSLLKNLDRYWLPFSTLNLFPKMLKFHILSKHVSLHKSADLALDKNYQLKLI